MFSWLSRLPHNAIGWFVLLVALACMRDGFLMYLGLIIVIPVVFGIQALFGVIARNFLEPAVWEKVKLLQVLPSVLVAGCILFWAFWGQQREIFKLTTGVNMPRSVSGFVFDEYAWTDYSVWLYCEISPEDLRAVLSRGGFTRGDRAVFMNWDGLSSRGSRKDLAGLTPAVMYLRGATSLWTNPEHDRMHLSYFVD